ncbi:MAG: glycosyl hydrolase family 95 catalytic domain-containing protein [Candidatus Brocadiia bacterium]
MNTQYTWQFPLPRTHTGILQGNGTMGTILWGRSSTLRLTLGRADFWDHRGGSEWTSEMNYSNIRDHLDRGDEETLNELFESKRSNPNEPDRPTVLPVGRIDLECDESVEVDEADLSITDGTIRVHTRDGNDIHVLHEMDRNVVLVKLPLNLAPADIQPVPSWQYVSDELSAVGFEPPETLSGKSIEGWIQRCPADPALCAGWAQKNGLIAIATARGDDKEASQKVAERVHSALQDGYDNRRKQCANWWKGYWQRAATVDLPNDRLQYLYDYGMYKFAGFTNPDGVAATLQGPWIEEYRMPPWSSDYHFNVNVQMCYQPAYHGNLVEHLEPLWEMIAGWADTLRHNAKMFLGINDGFMLPHAVSDDCRFICSYWGHSVDHGCTAWVAQMMFRHYRYTMDEDFLRETALPFMRATMRVYEEMLEKTENGNFRLPVGISPEYFNSGGKGYGANASFQLACIHRLCEDLLEACSVLDEKPKPVWEDIQENLPRACLIEDDAGERIALWEGQDLEESHRHHSHLAAITPFDVIDPYDEGWEEIVRNSLARWIYRGPGLWSGWCMTWASCLNTHCGNPEAAVLWLEVFDRFFTNEGGGTLHDCRASGISLMGAPAMGGTDSDTDVMQMDGGMGSVGAIHEMLLHTRGGVNHLFAGVPDRWDEVSFDSILTDGAFEVSAERESGDVRRVVVESRANGTFCLANPWNKARIEHEGEKVSTCAKSQIRIQMGEGETVVISGDRVGS